VGRRLQLGRQVRLGPQGGRRLTHQDRGRGLAHEESLLHEQTHVNRLATLAGLQVSVTSTAFPHTNSYRSRIQAIPSIKNLSGANAYFEIERVNLKKRSTAILIHCR